MKNKIQEVQEYFIQKIVAGDYEIQNSTEHYGTVLIDGKYKFTLWIANGANYFNPYSFQYNFIQVEIPHHLRESGFAKFQEKYAEILEAKTIAEIQELENLIENKKQLLK